MKHRQIYWLTTPCNRENWFVVASSQNNAESFHDHGEGFDPGYSKAKFVCKVPLKILRTYHNEDEDYWPSMELLNILGFNVIAKNFPRIVSYNGNVYYEGRNYWINIEENLNEYPGVYVINASNTNKFKIGSTKNLISRLKTFRTNLPYQIDLRYYIMTPQRNIIEKYLHKELREYRRLGEWFDLENEELKKLESICKNLNSENCIYIDIQKIIKEQGIR